MASFKGSRVGTPWSRWNSGQASQPGKRFTLTGTNQESRGAANPAGRKDGGR